MSTMPRYGKGFIYRETLRGAVRLGKRIGWDGVTFETLALELEGTDAEACYMTLRSLFQGVQNMRYAVLVAISKELRGHVDPFEPICRNE